ncbi:MAG: hypothetical protein HDR80_06730 [Bacteroides sp.]|nr:hypothetical protein [Bacteroides sp.]
METANVHTNNIWLMIKKEAMENRRKSLLFTAGWTGLSGLVGGWMGYFGVGGGEYSTLFIYVLMYLVMTALLASLAFNDMKTREGRIALLMTPATAGAKVLTRAISLFIGCFVLGILGYLGMEVCRTLIDGVVNHHWGGLFFPRFNMIFRGAGYDDTLWGVLLFGAGAYFGVAFYFLGSVLWPKYSFLKTMVAGWLLQMVFGMAVVWMARGSLVWLTGLNPEVFIKISTLMVYLVATGLFFLAWWRLKRATVLPGIFG